MTEKPYLIGFKPQYGNLWRFHRPDPRYGTNKYPGRFSGQSVKNLLWLYTDEGDIVIDPFAGGGTAQDVCDEWKRKCYSSDIRPCRTDIEKRDVVTDEMIDIKAKLILLDPPYGSMLKGKWTDDPTNLSNMTIEKFYDTMEKVGTECLSRLQYGGRIALYCGIIKKYRYICTDLTFDLINIFKEIGYVVEERIVEPQLNSSSIVGSAVVSARKKGYLLRLYKDIIIFVRNDYDPKNDKKFDKKWLKGWDARDVFK